MTVLVAEANLGQERLEAARLVDTEGGTEMRWQCVSNEFSSHLVRLAVLRLEVFSIVQKSPCSEG